MPQRASVVETSNPFGPSLFSTNWSSTRDRATTLTSIRSSDAPDSPAQSSFSKDGLTDADVRTLDYLGLAETPRQTQASLVSPGLMAIADTQRAIAMQPFLAELANFNNKNLNRFRSYSVNAKEKYATDDDDQDYIEDGRYSGLVSGTMTPLAASAAAALAATQAQIHQHNLAVQAFANQASANRPRARTAGVLDSPLRTSGRNYLAMPSRLDNSMTATDFGISEATEYDGLPEAVRAMQLAGFGNRPVVEASDQNSEEGPTRALWLGNIPTSTTVSSLQAIFSIYGNIESARVLMHKNCGFVNFEKVESAVQARSLLNGREIFPGAGQVRIGYAKAPSGSVGGTSGNNGPLQPDESDLYSKAQTDSERTIHTDDNAQGHHINGGHAETSMASLEIPELSNLREEMLQIVAEFGANDQDQVQISGSIDATISFNDFEDEIPTVPEPSHTRIHDAPKLREIRKRIDNNAISQAEIEEIAIGMLPEVAELASDYLGNTVVQKLFEFCSEAVKEQMLYQIVPHLAETGVHKNGTWAAQKIIDVTKIPNQMAMIVDSLRRHTVSLFLDQYGNYVLQCCLRFGYPYNNFIFETMLSRMWDIAQGRFGARAMRACLESHHATKEQQRMLASAIALHSVQLATNSNGALLLTWFLDTCTFPRRRTVLAPRLIPHLVYLCTHKVAYLTVLKVINQRNEPDARTLVLEALFFSKDDRILENILSDQACGATLIFKILTTPFFDESLRSDVVENVRNVLSRLKMGTSQSYKRLMDEVGLSTKLGRPERDSSTSNGHGSHHDRSRPVSQHGPHNERKQRPEMERQYSGQHFQQAQQQYPSHNSNPGTPGVDRIPQAYEQYNLNGMNSSTSFAPNYNPQQLQLQQQMLPAPARGVAPADFYNSMPMPNYGGFVSPPPSMENNVRNIQGQYTPMTQFPPMTGRPAQMSPGPMLQSVFAAPPGYNPTMANSMMGGYQYQMQYMPPRQMMMQQQAGGRRGRVSQDLTI